MLQTLQARGLAPQGKEWEWTTLPDGCRTDLEDVTERERRELGGATLYATYWSWSKKSELIYAGAVLENPGSGAADDPAEACDILTSIRVIYTYP